MSSRELPPEDGACHGDPGLRSKLPPERGESPLVPRENCQGEPSLPGDSPNFQLYPPYLDHVQVRGTCTLSHNKPLQPPKLEIPNSYLHYPYWHLDPKHSLYRLGKDPGGTTNGRKLYLESTGRKYNPDGHHLNTKRGREQNHFTDEEKKELGIHGEQVAEYLFSLALEEVDKTKKALDEALHELEVVGEHHFWITTIEFYKEFPLQGELTEILQTHQRKVAKNWAGEWWAPFFNPNLYEFKLLFPKAAKAPFPPSSRLLQKLKLYVKVDTLRAELKFKFPKSPFAENNFDWCDTFLQRARQLLDPLEPGLQEPRLASKEQILRLLEEVGHKRGKVQDSRAWNDCVEQLQVGQFEPRNVAGPGEESLVLDHRRKLKGAFFLDECWARNKQKVVYQLRRDYCDLSQPDAKLFVPEEPTEKYEAEFAEQDDHLQNIMRGTERSSRRGATRFLTSRANEEKGEQL